MTRSLLLLSALAACNGPEALTSGAVHLCLGADSIVDEVELDDITHWLATGTVVSDAATPAAAEFAVSDCWTTPARTLSLTDGDGVTWRVGYGLEHEGDDVTAPLGVTAGEIVSFDFIRTMVWGWDFGVVVRDADDDLLLAGQEGMATMLDSTPGNPLAPLRVHEDEPYGPTANLDCGRARNVLARFVGDTTVELEAGETADLAVDGVALKAHNAGSFNYIGDMNCTDTWGPFSYLVWR
jgi:hypothetical protein